MTVTERVKQVAGQSTTLLMLQAIIGKLWLQCEQTQQITETNMDTQNGFSAP